MPARHESLFIAFLMHPKLTTSDALHGALLQFDGYFVSWRAMPTTHGGKRPHYDIGSFNVQQSALWEFARHGEARESRAVLEGSEVTLVELEVLRFSSDRQYRDGSRAVSSPFLCSRYGFVTGNQLFQRVVLCGFGHRLADALPHTNDNSALFEPHFIH
jgi:hypothetical protein